MTLVSLWVSSPLDLTIWSLLLEGRRSHGCFNFFIFLLALATRATLLR